MKKSSKSKTEKTVVINKYIYIYSQTFRSYYFLTILALFDPFCMFYSMQIFSITNRQKAEWKTITLNFPSLYFEKKKNKKKKKKKQTKKKKTFQVFEIPNNYYIRYGETFFMILYFCTTSFQDWRNLTDQRLKKQWW